MTTAALLQQWFREVWNNANESFIDQAMDHDVVIHGLDPTGTTRGINNFKQFYKNFRESFPAIHIDIDPLLHNEEFAAGFCKVTAHHVKGNNVSFSGICVIRCKDDKLVEGWNNFDFLKMYQQLGHVLMSEIAG